MWERLRFLEVRSFDCSCSLAIVCRKPDMLHLFSVEEISGCRVWASYEPSGLGASELQWDLILSPLWVLMRSEFWTLLGSSLGVSGREKHFFLDSGRRMKRVSMVCPFGKDTQCQILQNSMRYQLSRLKCHCSGNRFDFVTLSVQIIDACASLPEALGEDVALIRD